MKVEEEFAREEEEGGKVDEEENNTFLIIGTLCSISIDQSLYQVYVFKETDRSNHTGGAKALRWGGGGFPLMER